MEWDVHSPDCWSRSLGMSRTALFGNQRPATFDGEHVVFIDGRAASFALSIGSDADDLLFGPTPASWAWSSFLRRALVLTKNSTRLFLRTWDDPSGAQSLRVPRSAAEAEVLMQKLSASKAPRAPDVVGRMIVCFKRLRAALSPYLADNLQVVRAFNLVIRVAEKNGVSELTQLSTIGDLLSAGTALGESGSLRDYAEAPVDAAIDAILSAAPPGIYPLEPHLLIRHASGFLYQEAHFELERPIYAQRTVFGHLASNETTRGNRQRDARLTPPELARTMIQESLSLTGSTRAKLCILDPACGSGVFLQEMLRELEDRAYRAGVNVTGFDASSIATEITRFCLNEASTDANAAGVTTEANVMQCDALQADWGSPDIILMNPPFASYKNMSDDERTACKAILGDLGVGLFDKAMAFIWKAVQSVKAGGIVASVLPSSLLEGSHGQKWREAILQTATLRTIGRFKGYSYFQGAMVEPAFLVMRKNMPNEEAGCSLTVLVAEENSEGAAMRALRKRQPSSEEDKFFLSFGYERSLSASSWMPKAYEHQALLDALAEPFSTVGQLFNVHQGVLTGSNRTFVLSARDRMNLPSEERKFFQPAAGTSTIRNGKIDREGYVFYPHGPDGPLFLDERDLIAHVPTYHAQWLAPMKSRLLERRDKNQSNWWTLTWPRAWQSGFDPKIVTAYFGSSGSFAFDSAGEFVCLHGYAWFWRDIDVTEYSEEDGISEEVTIPFTNTQAPFAYVALLNSKPFNVLLSCFCQRVQGGQFNLSRRFVSNVPIPDLVTGHVPGDVVAALAETGRCFAEGESIDHEALSNLTARAYGIPLSRWNLTNPTHA